MDNATALGIAAITMRQKYAKLIVSEGYLTVGGAFRPVSGKPRNKELEDLHRAIPIIERLQRAGSGAR